MIGRIAPVAASCRRVRRHYQLAASLLLVVLTAGGVAAQDWDRDPVARWLNEHSLELIGAASAAMLLSGDDETTDGGERALDAAVVSAAAAGALKAVVDESRPREPSADDGFPSGHTAIAFGFARAITEWRSDGWPAFYGFASAVGWARVEEGYHDLDQVLAGAALGLLVADRSLGSGGLLLRSSDRPARSLIAGDTDFIHGGEALSWSLWAVEW